MLRLAEILHLLGTVGDGKRTAEKNGFRRIAPRLVEDAKFARMTGQIGTANGTLKVAPTTVSFVKTARRLVNCAEFN